MTHKIPRIPDNLCLYAIGDIHGHKQKLEELMAGITEDAEQHQGSAKRLIFIGDYIDRGPASKGVIDYLLYELPEGFEAIFLRGNHEDVALRVLHGDVELIASWLQFGGAACLASYNVNAFRPRIVETPEILQAEFAENIPPAHKHFLEDTVLSYECGDYYFTHAGVRPGTALAKQSSDDLLWIRDEFLGSKEDFGKIVVHGHSISTDPDIHPNRIGIDTGAYATGRLTCLKLFEDKRQFLMT
jgi:serine/threonine protein phosphatase 1